MPSLRSSATASSPVSFGHRDIADNDIRLQRSPVVQQFAAGRRHTYEFEFLTKHLLQSLQQNQVIVCQEDAHAFHDRPF
jgi:hypothetical protein